MKLKPEEFALIRPLEWRLINIGTKTYNTPKSDIARQLFWLDFLRKVFVPKFKAQQTVTVLGDFDLTEPVLMSDDLELLLPPLLETVVYYATNKTLPFMFKLEVSMFTVLIVGIVLIFATLIVKCLFFKFPLR